MILRHVSTLTPEEIAQHAHDAGFRGDDLATAVAVAMAESGGNTQAHNGVGPDDSYGLWQINMEGDLGPARRDAFGLNADRELYDPATNAQAAHDIYSDRGDFTAWSTYDSGEYEQFMDAARKAAAQVTGDSAGNGDSGSDGSDPGGEGGGSGTGFEADTAAMLRYSRTATEVGETLKGVGSRTGDVVRGVAEDSFGDVGRETGFTEALRSFSRSLTKQLTATGETAKNLGSAVREAAETYRKADEESVAELTRASSR